MRRHNKERLERSEAAESERPEVKASKRPKIAARIITAAIIAAPVLILSFALCRDLYFLRNSDIVLIYLAEKDIGIGSITNIAYAVSDKWCEEVDVGVADDARSMEDFLPKNFRSEDPLPSSEEYSINLGEYRAFIPDMNSDRIIIYKNGDQLHEITLDEGFTITELQYAFIAE